jgi:hypothetical protein
MATVMDREGYNVNIAYPTTTPSSSCDVQVQMCRIEPDMKPFGALVDEADCLSWCRATMAVCVDWLHAFEECVFAMAMYMVCCIIVVQWQHGSIIEFKVLIAIFSMEVYNMHISINFNPRC